MTAGSDQNTPSFERLGKLEFESTACPVCGATEIGRELHKVVQGIEMHFRFCAVCSTLYANPAHDRGLTADSVLLRGVL